MRASSRRAAADCCRLCDVLAANHPNLNGRKRRFMFTLNLGTGEYILTKENIRIPVQTQEFAINMSNMRHWGSSCSEVRSGTF